MAGSGTAAALAVVLVMKLGITTAAALWPLRGHLHCLTRLRRILHVYSLPDSNLDVWLLAVLESLLLLALLYSVRTPARQSLVRSLAQPPYRQVRRAIRMTAGGTELLLLFKAVAVAVAGREAVLPLPGHLGHAGLLCMYVAIVAAVLASFVESWACARLARGWEEDRDAATDAEQPLLPPEEGGKTKIKQSATIAALLRMAAPDSPILALAFTAGSAAALGQALIPYYTGRIIDYASIDPDRDAFRRTTLKMLAVALACALFTGVRGGLFTLAMTRLNVRLRTALFGALMAQELGFFDVSRAGEITSRLAADTTTVSDQVCLNLNVMLRSATQAAMVLAFMLSASWRLTVVTFVLVPLVLAMCKVYGRFYRRMSKKVQTELAEANSVADEALSSMATVKAHAAEESVQGAYAAKLKAFYLLQRSEAAAYAAYMGANTFLSAAVVAAVLYYGGSLVLAGSMSAGALVSFMLYQQSLSGSFQALGDVFSALSAAVGAADKVVELMQRQPRIPPAGTLRPPEFGGRVELADVVFAYPARPALRVLCGLSLAVSPGEIVALVGPSGGGKSSIVKLVQRFYLPQGGSVRLDGRDVGQYDHRWLRRRVALVSQEPVLYARSILRNIQLGMEAEDGVDPGEVPSQEEVEAAARLANAHDFITRLPAGYATDCGEKGVQLSGGQKQRIAIARALLRRPTVLLLDEATSALDADSEAAVQEALDRTMAGRTVLVIAHRLSTVVDAHRIAVVAGGAVVEEGTHGALLEAGGVYAGLVRRQLTRSASSSASLVRSASAASDLVLR